jgi:hypothetical protein
VVGYSGTPLARKVGVKPGMGKQAALWVAWPRRAGGHTSDVSENDLRDLFLPTGLVDVKVAALDADRSGLKFVWCRGSAVSPRVWLSAASAVGGQPHPYRADSDEEQH